MFIVYFASAKCEYAFCNFCCAASWCELHFTWHLPKNPNPINVTKSRVCSTQFHWWCNDYFGHHSAGVAVKFALNLAPKRFYSSSSRTAPPHHLHPACKEKNFLCKLALHTLSSHDVPISTLFCPSHVRLHSQTRGGGCEIGKQVHCQGLANAH